MQVAHQRLQAFFQNMGIDLRRGNIGVAEQRLHHAQVGAVVQEMAGDGMSRADGTGESAVALGGGSVQCEIADVMDGPFGKCRLPTTLVYSFFNELQVERARAMIGFDKGSVLVVQACQL